MAEGGAGTAGTGRVSMRLLASSRLAIEIERERQRELDLRRLGCISTISEERACQPPQVPAFTAATVAACFDAASNHSDAGSDSSEHRRVASAFQVDDRRSPDDVIGVESPRDGVALPVPNGGHREVKLSSSSAGAAAGAAGSRRSAAGGAQQRQTTELIEKELRELQLRELELRKQRASVTGVMTSPVDDSNSEHVTNSSFAMTSSSSNGDINRGDRRRSTLIDQWENRIGKDGAN
jgi:hypothetical protein